jgi:uncharacterized NAD(P)/FAD-binding protein YdhS
MADVAVSLLSRGHRATITAVSRRGLLARPQGVFADDANFLEGIAAPTTALELLRLVRRRVRASIASGSGWHPAIDALRYNLPQIWRAMPEVERRRIARRLLPFWDVHRFRVAPAVHSVLERAICDGRLVVEKAGVTSIGVERSALMAVLRRPGGRLERRRFQGIVLCIGPERDPTRIPLVGALLAAGLARLDAVGLGLDVDAGSHLVSGDGTINPSLLAFGPMTRGAFGEMTGAPDIARHVERIVGLMASGVA